MPAWTPEEAKEAGRRGGLASAETRRNQAKLASDLRARKVFEDASPDMADELVRAARGEPPWDELPLAVRVGLVQKVLEFGIGRPGAGPKRDAKDEGPADDHGFVIGGGDGN